MRPRRRGPVGRLLVLCATLFTTTHAARLNFAPNITRDNTRWPRTIAWDVVCAAAKLYAARRVGIAASICGVYSVR